MVLFIKLELECRFMCVLFRHSANVDNNHEMLDAARNKDRIESLK